MSKPAKGDMKTDGAPKATKTTKAAKTTKDKPDVKASDAATTVRQRFLLSADALAALVDKLAAAGTPAVAPAWTNDGAALAAGAAAAPGTTRETEYRAVSGAAELALGERLPRLSLKQYFLPPTEVLFSYRRNGGGEVELTPAPTDFAAQVVLGARPCDAAALPIVDKVMNWDYADELWNARRAATTIFSLACGVEDDSCFCSAVFLDPATAQGADGLLTPVDDGYLVETLSDKGDAFVAAHAESFAALAAGADKATTEQAESFRAAAGERVAHVVDGGVDEVVRIAPVEPRFERAGFKAGLVEEIVDEGNAQKRLASGAAEDVWVNALLVFVVLLVYPRFKGYEALGLILVKSRIDGTGLGDKLMKLKGQNCVPRPLFHELLIDETDPMKEVSDSLLANGCGLP